VGVATDVPNFDPSECSLQELACAQADGRTTAVELTHSYLRRIATLDRDGPRLGAVLAVNPDALAAAQGLDAERYAGKLRGPLHGIPLLLKDNIETLDPLPTTAGSLALEAARHRTDAPVAARLRAAGAIVLGKANLTEWANCRSPHSISGWSAVGGQTRNAYDGSRNPSGSSSGPAVAAAANLCAASIGTETDGSLLAPASINGIVGIKPTAGLVSSQGVVPISPRQDTAGPMARSVADVALLLSVMAQPSAQWDRATTPLGDIPKGLRIGVLPPPASAHPEAVRDSQGWFKALAQEGAVLVDVEPPKAWSTMPDEELDVLLYEIKAALNNYLAGFNGSLAVRTLADLIEFNTRHAAEEMPFFGQEYFEQAETRGPLSTLAYRKKLRHLLHVTDEAGLSALFAKHRVDVLVAAGNGPAELIDRVWGDRYESSGGWPPMASAAAVAGYPSLTVPAGFVSGLPVGIAFVGRRFRDGLLLQIGRMFERTIAARRPPHFEVAY
jgi:amidase